MKVLITGGLGFIGRNIAREYSKEHEVTILTRTLNKKNLISNFKKSIMIIEKDINDIGTLVSDKDIIFHCASTVDNYNILDNPGLDIKTNCVGTLALLEACRRFNPNARIIFVSTFFVYGNQEDQPVKESNKECPLGLYGATKLAAENFCKSYMRVFGLKPIIARLSNVYGTDETPYNNKKAAFNRMVYLAATGDPINLYDNGKVIRDYIYITDVISGLKVIAERGKIGETYNVSTGEGHTLREMVDLIKKEFPSTKVNPINVPDFHKAVGINDFVCDNTKLQEIGWKPRVSIYNGIKLIARRYLDEVVNA